MRCTIATRVNRGELIDKTEKFGSKLLSENVTEIFNDKTFKSNIKVWSNARLEKLEPLKKAVSYVFSNDSEPTIEGLRNIGLTDKADLKILEQSGANLPKDFSSHIFSSRPDTKLSSSPYNHNVLIIEGAKPKDTDDRKFVHISADDMATADMLAVRNYNGDEKYMLTPTKTRIDDSIEFFVISALYRGFNISFDSSIDSAIIKRAAKKFSFYLGNEAGKNIRHLSTMRRDRNIQKIDTSIDEFIHRLDNTTPSDGLLPTINDNNLFVNTFLSPSERRHFKTFKKANNSAKVAVAKRITGVFKSMMPNLEVEYLTSTEISNRFGEVFANKKGFNINNVIVVNLDKFSSVTLFHEFGHFYLSWLKSYDEEAYTALLKVVENEFSDRIEETRNLYSIDTNLRMSDTQILEEIFVEELGIKSIKELDTILEITEENDIADTVDAFALSYLQSLTRRINIKLKDTTFSINSSIQQIYNLAFSFSSTWRKSMLTDKVTSEEMDSLAEFFIEKVSPRNVFDSLVARGLIRYSSGNKIILMDSFGNIYNKNGEIDDFAEYNFTSWNDLSKADRNEKLLRDIEPYLSTFANEAFVSYRIDTKPKTGPEIVRAISDSIVLSEDDKTYIIGGTDHVVRASTYSEKEFISDKPPGTFINAEIYHTKVRDYTRGHKKAGKKDDEALDLAINEAADFILNKKDNYQTMYDRIEEVFDFKTNEGTFVHALNEFYFLSLNIASTIDHKTKGKKTYAYFSKTLIKNISKLNTSESIQHFRNLYFNPMIDAGLAHTTEYKRFEALYAELQLATLDKDTSNIIRALTLTEKDILPVLNKLSGPLTIMPEVRVGNVVHGVAGTIDLLVFDKNGVAYLYDYKNKQSGKHGNWNFPSSVRMANEMEAYADNAKIKASIQLSLYKVFLNAAGIQVGSMNVFYIENDLEGIDEHLFSESREDALQDTLKYTPENIIVEPIFDVSAELVASFKRNGVVGPNIDKDSTTTDITTAVTAFSGGVNIDFIDDIDAKASRIYEDALNIKANKNSNLDKKNAKLRMIMQKVHKTIETEKGLRVKLSDNSYFTLEAGMSSKTKIIAVIKKKLLERHDVKSVENMVFDIFNGLDRSSNTAKQDEVEKAANKTIRGLLKHMDPVTHELTKASSNHGLGEEFSGILYGKNRMTGHTRILVINTDNNETLGFGGRTNYSVFGNYISNRVFKAKYKRTSWKNTTKYMRLIKVGLHIAMEKQKNSNFTVSEILANDPLSLGNIPELIDVPTVLAMTKDMIELAISHGETLPASIVKLLDSPHLFDAETYQHNPITALLNFMSFGSGNLIRTKELFRTGSKSEQYEKRLRKLLEEHDQSAPNIHEMINALIRYRVALEKNVYTTREARLSSDHYRATDHLIITLRNMSIQVKYKELGQVTNLFMPSTRGANYHSAALARSVSGSIQTARTMQAEFKHEANIMLKKLVDDAGLNISSMGPALFKSSMKEIFTPLYTTDNTTRKTAYILKSYKDKKLSPVQREYLKWVNDTLQKYAKMSRPGSKVEIRDGFIPLIGRSRQSTGNLVVRAADGLSRLFEGSHLTKKEGKVDEHFKVEGKYNSQYTSKSDEGSSDTQWNNARRRMLGLNAEMGDSANAINIRLDRFEDNIENILDAVVENAIKVEIFEKESELNKAVLNEAARQELVTDIKLGGLADSIDISQKRNIQGQEDDSTGGGIIKYLGRMVTKIALAGSIAQVMLESFTNPMVASTRAVRENLFRAFVPVRKDREGIEQKTISVRSFNRAHGIVMSRKKETSDLVTALDIMYGISIYDQKAVSDKLNMLESSNITNSNALMSLNKMPLDFGQRVVFIAYLIDRGSYDAHSLSTDGSNRLIYDESKDLFFRKLSSDTKDKKLLKDKLKASTKTELAKELNGLDGKFSDPIADRKMLKALTRYEANSLKDSVVETFSSMDSAGRSNASFYIILAPFLKMKQFLIAKFPRYFGSYLSADENQSAAQQVRIPDESAEGGYRIEYKSFSSEGIFYSLGSLFGLLLAKGHKMKREDFTENQFENYMKLFTDVMMMALYSIIGTGIFGALQGDDEEEDPFLALLKARYEMATYDIFFLYSLGKVVGSNSSMSVTLSVTLNTLGSFASLFVGVIGTGAEDFTAQDYSDLMFEFIGDTHGIGKSVELLYQEQKHLTK